MLYFISPRKNRSFVVCHNSPESMKILIYFFVTAATGLILSAENELSDPKRITQEEAAEMVQEREIAKERAKDEREAELRSANIIQTTVADLGDQKVIFNRVRMEKKSATAQVPRTATSEVSPTFSIEDFMDQQSKENLTFSLSGVAFGEEGKVISELWWRVQDEYCRVFVNADFSLFTGIADVENETTRYSPLMVVTRQIERSIYKDDWQPGWSDFTEGELEYFIVDCGNLEQPPAEYFVPIELMIRYYAENLEDMKLARDNAQTMRAAREAYLEANPPKKRDTIINMWPEQNSRYMETQK